MTQARRPEGGHAKAMQRVYGWPLNGINLFTDFLSLTIQSPCQHFGWKTAAVKEWKWCGQSDVQNTCAVNWLTESKCWLTNNQGLKKKKSQSTERTRKWKEQRAKGHISSPRQMWRSTRYDRPSCSVTHTLIYLWRPATISTRTTTYWFSMFFFTFSNR